MLRLQIIKIVKQGLTISKFKVRKVRKVFD